MRIVLWIVLLWMVGACDSEGNKRSSLDASGRPLTEWLNSSLEDFPEELQRADLYSDVPDSLPGPELIRYQPAWPLWSNGSKKERWAFLPAAIDGNDEDRWVFPIGTAFFKTFTYPTADGVDQLIETRVMRRGGAGWGYAVYRWDESGAKAQRLDSSEQTPVVVQTEAGEITHTIPSPQGCRICHEASERFILGFSELQLLDTEGSENSLLYTLIDEELIIPKPLEIASLNHQDPTTRQVLGYFHGNCVHCHNGSYRPYSAFDLRQDVALENLVNQLAVGSGTRVVPGQPKESVLFQAVSRESDRATVRFMPPISVDVLDTQSIDLLYKWITDMK